MRGPEDNVAVSIYHKHYYAFADMLLDGKFSGSSDVFLSVIDSMTPSKCQWTPELFDLCVVDPAHPSSAPLYHPAYHQSHPSFEFHHDFEDATIDLNSPPAPQRPPSDIPSILHCFRAAQESTDAGIESTPLVDISLPKTASSETTVVAEEASKLDKGVCRAFSTFESANIHDRSLLLPAEIVSAGTGRIGGFGRSSTRSSPLVACLR